MEESPHLTIEVVWEDTDLEELSISANNGRYSGKVEVYFALGDVQLLANSIRGFPKTTSQQEVFTGGNDTAYPFAELVFYCTDGTGHPAVQVTLAETVYHSGQPVTENRVKLEVLFEATELDEFCRELDLVARRKTKRALLRGRAAQQFVGRERNQRALK